MEKQGRGKPWAGETGWAAPSAGVIHVVVGMAVSRHWQFSETQWKPGVENHLSHGVKFPGLNGQEITEKRFWFSFMLSFPDTGTKNPHQNISISFR